MWRIVGIQDLQPVGERHRIDRVRWEIFAMSERVDRALRSNALFVLFVLLDL